MIILIDNYDSFTFNIYHYLSEIGSTVKVYRNDEISIQEIDKMNPSAIVLSPGPCTPNETGICINLVKKFESKIPILGICLGHQTIAQALGAKIIHCEEIVHGKICDIKHTFLFSINDYTTCILIILVVPVTPTGAPAVIIYLSPSLR